MAALDDATDGPRLDVLARPQESVWQSVCRAAGRSGVLFATILFVQRMSERGWARRYVAFLLCVLAVFWLIEVFSRRYGRSMRLELTADRLMYRSLLGIKAVGLADVDAVEVSEGMFSAALRVYAGQRWVTFRRSWSEDFSKDFYALGRELIRFQDNVRHNAQLLGHSVAGFAPRDPSRSRKFLLAYVGALLICITAVVAGLFLKQKS